ncbi:MAG: MotA/TolQ/ExbB proton channel family protein [Planctomycetaceae bacterium]
MLSRLTSVRAGLRLIVTPVLASLMAASLSMPAFGYQDAATDAAASSAAAPAAEPAAAPPAAEGTAPAAAPAAAAAEAPAQQTSMLQMIWGGLGWVWGPIFLILSFIMVAVIMMNLLALRRDALLPAPFVELFEQKLQTKDYQGAYDTARADDSFVARVLAAGLGRLNRGYEEAIEGMQEVGEEETMTMEHKIGYLALIASVAPMLGLLGTVQGMIASFQVIATAESAPKPKDLASGISTAMVTTLAGLIVSIPAMIAFSLLKNRMARLVLEVGIVSEGLMARFNRKPGTGGAAPVGAPAQRAE